MGRKLVVGLGNPGPEYEATWHNLGFHAVRAFAKVVRTSLKSKRDSLIGRGRFAGHDVFLILPQTYMNRSGRPVARIARENRIEDENILVVIDDHDLPRGLLRMRESGGDGGHRGLRSVLEEVGTNQVPRLRIGFRNEAVDSEVGGYDDLADRVLEPVGKVEKKHMASMAKAAAEAIRDWVALGSVSAMNHHNNRRIMPPGEAEGSGESEVP